MTPRGPTYNPELHDERARTSIERGLILGGAGALREAAAVYKLAACHRGSDVAAVRKDGDIAVSHASDCLKLAAVCAASRLPPTSDERLEWLDHVSTLRMGLRRLLGEARRDDRQPPYYVRPLLSLLDRIAHLDWADDAVWLCRLPRREAAEGRT